MEQTLAESIERSKRRKAWQAVIAAADLPSEVKVVVTTVIRRSRLSRREKSEVADELISHFADGRSAGASMETLLSRFGDPALAADLIRRAKIRNRSLIWHGWKWCRRFAAVLVIAYGGAGVMFYASSPHVAVDYLAEMNRTARASAVDDRAWPLYREAIATLKLDDAHSEWNERISDYVYHPQGPDDAKLAAWIDHHSDAINRVRDAAAKPVFGFVLGQDETPKPGIAREKNATLSQTVVDASIEYLDAIRPLARLLQADARIAAERGDGARCAADIFGLLNMADQVGGPHRLLIDDIVAASLRTLGYVAINEILRNEPAVLDDSALLNLSERISQPRTPADLLSTGGEQLLFKDLLQRIYSDDGHGDGHLTAAGLSVLAHSTAQIETMPLGEKAAGLLLGPGAMLIWPSRADLSAADQQLMDNVKASLEAPFYTPIDLTQTLGDKTNGIVGRTRFALVLAIAPALTRLPETGQRCLAARDGAWCGIALEQYRRQHGRYPEKLDALVPAYLPYVPADRITGEAVKYKLIQGKPVIYSVGGDRKDDGGRAATFHDEPQPSSAAYWTPRAKPIDGDWILFDAR